jgi:hypothetical protein
MCDRLPLRWNEWLCSIIVIPPPTPSPPFSHNHSGIEADVLVRQRQRGLDRGISAHTDVAHWFRGRMPDGRMDGPLIEPGEAQ